MAAWCVCAISEVSRRVSLIPIPMVWLPWTASMVVTFWGCPKSDGKFPRDILWVLSWWIVSQLSVLWIAMESAGVCELAASERQLRIKVKMWRMWVMVMRRLTSILRPWGHLDFMA